MIQFRNLQLTRGVKTLIKDASFQLHVGHKVGLTGANGSGKSSLFALLRGELHAESGDVEIPSQWVIAHVAQETPALAASAIEFTLDGDAELRAIEHALAKAEAGNAGAEVGELHARLNEIDGYAARARAAALLHGLGFSNEDMLRPVSDFSGGWRVRLNLAKALMCRSDLLLLDEPTNHLDLDAVIWLEGWLKDYRGTLLLISHDRDFLDAVVNHILHIEQQQLTLYRGNYSDFEKQRAERLIQQQANFDRQQRETDDRRQHDAYQDERDAALVPPEPVDHPQHGYHPFETGTPTRPLQSNPHCVSVPVSPMLTVTLGAGAAPGAITRLYL